MGSALKSVVVGLASGVITYVLSFYALGYTNSFVMPHGFPLALWNVLAVFGVGVTFVALIIQFVGLRVSHAQVLPALAGFVVAVLGFLVIGGNLQHGYKALLAWVVGAGFASIVHLWLRPNISFKPKPLRGSA